MMVTEWNKGFDPVSVEDLAFEPRRVALVAASILAMMEAGLDWSFYYHIWDQVCYADDFKPFFSPSGIENMVRHWNEVPHRFGLFGGRGETRPQYFIYQMLKHLGEERIAAHADCQDIRVLAARSHRALSVFIVNLGRHGSEDMVLTLHFSKLSPGRKHLTTYRIDAERKWSSETLELIPIEHREVDTLYTFHCQVYSPADSVAMVQLSDTRDV